MLPFYYAMRHQPTRGIGWRREVYHPNLRHPPGLIVQIWRVNCDSILAASLSSNCDEQNLHEKALAGWNNYRHLHCAQLAA
jgi:hypothetical protein